MATIHETAYPRLKASITPRDLEEVYQPTPEELALATSHTRNDTTRACFVLLLKTFQRLGYFVYLHDVPVTVVHYIADHLGVTCQPGDLHTYDASGTRRRHVASIRAYLRVQPFDQVAQTVLEQTIREAAQTKEDLADIINVGIEELVWIGFSNAIFPRRLREPLGSWSSRSGRTRGWWQRCRGGAEGCSNAPRKA